MFIHDLNCITRARNFIMPNKNMWKIYVLINIEILDTINKNIKWIKFFFNYK